MSRRDEHRLISRVRGLLLGLALGDAAAHAGERDRLLSGSVATQLAAFVTEGTIRAIVRAHHRGIGALVGPIWHAYCRWAALQGIDAPVAIGHWRHGNPQWPSGWLADIPVLRERRGSAPATVAALQSGRTFGGTIAEPVTDSAGAHAVTSSLPTAAVGAVYRIADWFAEAQQVAALTHGAFAGHASAATAGEVAARCIDGSDVATAIEGALDALRHRPAGASLAARLAEAVARATDSTPDPATLRRLAPDRSAQSAVAGAFYVAWALSQRTEVADAVELATSARDAPAVAAVAGALLGAAHGVEALPVEGISRLELGWVLDALARDLVTELLHHPSGDEDTDADDPLWWSRYPGG